MSRVLSREAAFCALFQLDFNDIKDEDYVYYGNLAIRSAVRGIGVFSKRDCKYVKEIVFGTKKHLEEIDKLIIDHLKEAWKLSRLGVINRTILRLAVYELKFEKPLISKAIAINEAVEIAKRYGDENSSRFINGILEAIAS